MTTLRRPYLIALETLILVLAAGCSGGGAVEEKNMDHRAAAATMAAGLGEPPAQPPTPTPAPPPTPTCGLMLAARINNAHVRRRPGEAKEDIFATLPANQKVPVVGRLPAEPKWTASPWWLIRLDDGRYGWIGSKVVILDGCPVPPKIVSAAGVAD